MKIEQGLMTAERWHGDFRNTRMRRGPRVPQEKRRADRDAALQTLRAVAAMMGLSHAFKKLHGPFVALCCGHRFKRSQIPAPASFGILFSRVQAIAGFHSSNHNLPPLYNFRPKPGFAMGNLYHYG